MDRRSLIVGGAALIAAPAIVRYEWIMPVKVHRHLPPMSEWPQVYVPLQYMREHAHILNMTLQHETMLYNTLLRKGHRSVQGYISKEFLEDHGGFAAEEMFKLWTEGV